MDGCSSGERKMEGREDQFTDLVLSMSLEELLENKYQVEKIPNSFQTVDEYFGSYILPLWEETRAELSAALVAVYKAPFAQVTTLTESLHDKLMYNVNVDYWRNRVGDRGKEPYRTLPGDVVILSDVKPETDRDLRRFGSRCVFASIQSMSEDIGCAATSFQVKTADHIEVEDLLRKSLYVVFLTNITTNKRIWKALKMQTNLKMIESILSKNKLDKESCECCSSRCNTLTDIDIGSTLLDDLNELQHDAIMASLHSLQCIHKPSVQLIWGPPGTGKTKTLSILLYVLLRMGIRTVVCAPTNVAVTALASRVVKLVRDSAVCKIQDDSILCPLGDILIFGNKDRLKVGWEIEDTFLDYRAESLYLTVHWKQHITSMTSFLRDCVSEHCMYIENEMENSKPKSLLEFARERFKHAALPLRECMLIIITHLPRRLVLEENVQCILQLMSLLDSIETLLQENTSREGLLERLFSYDDDIGDPDADLGSLSHIRVRCLSVLQTLDVSLEKVEFPSFTNRSLIEEFCFQKASLVFCSASSAYKLHNVKADPFYLLVIDEAAQLKECESLIALQIPDVTHAILAGDEKQLPTTVTSMVAEEAGFGRSLFERLSSLGNFKHLLGVQYRMHPSISLFPNTNFYQNQILDAQSVQSSSYERCYLEGRMFGPYSFINIVDGVEQLDVLGRSRRNMVEVAIVVKLVQKLFKEWINGSKEKISIGVISPYTAQVLAVQDKVKCYAKHEGFEIKVKSIDGFQGGEEDIIIVSTVRANEGGSIGFLSSPRRANVALTRARHCLWILGNAKTLSSSNSVWKELVLDAKCRGCFFNVDEDSEIAKASTDAKKELDQLDSVLNADNALFKNARWKVIFSDNFRKSFGMLTPIYVKKSAMNLLLKIASGWRPKKIDVDTTLNVSSNIVKKFKVEDYHIICCIDVIKEDALYKQVLKVWDILPLGHHTKLFDRLDNIFAMYTDEFTNHCKEKCLEGTLEVPKYWPTDVDIIRFKNSSDTNEYASALAVHPGKSLEDSKVSESLLLMKFYSLSSSVANHLLSGNDREEVDLPFEVTEEEREIILFPKSSFILGRSGTGKTTVLTMKLYRTLQQHLFASARSTGADENDYAVINLRQIFVSVSPKLCYAVKAHVSHLKRFASGDFSSSNSSMWMDNLADDAEFKDIPDSFVDIQPEKYPLIITFNKFIRMLDGTLGNSYFKRFRELRDSSHSVALETFIRKKEVTYDRFRSFYWPHFNERTKNFDSSRVYTEIMSHIKGGLLAGEACDTRLRKQDYISLSNSRVSTLSGVDREVIYGIFESYEKMKMERGEFDLADLVIDIHHRLKNVNLMGDKVEFVYIDEVQDLTMMQIALFKYICNNVNEGFVFSGDTAQTIARGVDFRFEDIRSLFYNEFLMNSKRIKRGERIEKGRVSDIFCLSQNFRTHSGVLRLANSIIDLLCHFFPHSIDVLAPETSLIYGESPVLLEADNDQNSIVTIFGYGGKPKGSWVGFGAEQVILVRDDLARDEISNFIGQQAIILTIVECKGLEFQDVLLYNFFGSSPVSNQWRVVYEFLNSKQLLDNNCQESFPSFSQSKHNILCSELKQLYVAITRTKQRLWICEKDEEASRPMFDYWRRLSLVQVRKIDDSVAETMHRSSSPEEWKAQGIKLFWEKNYEMATMCFEKAGEAIWVKRAKASGLRAAADRLRDSNPNEANVMLREAAELFDSIGRADSAAECFCDLGQYERAGAAYHAMQELKKAGECFTLAGSYERAALVFSEGNYFTECLSACTKGKYFDMGLQYVDSWRRQGLQEMNTTGQGFLENCAREFYRAKDKKSLLNFVRAFYTMDSKRNFLNSLECLEELLILEEEGGNFYEAANIAKVTGDLPQEAELLGKAGDYVEASNLIISYVLSNSLWMSGNKGWPLNSFPQKQQLLDKAVSFAENVPGSFHALVSTEAEILSNGQTSLSELVQNDNASRKCGSLMGEILSKMKLLDVHLKLNSKKYEWEFELPHGSISGNQVSVMTLFSTWNSHKEHILEILKCLNAIGKHDSEKFDGIAEFCFRYFGVRVLDSLTGRTYRLLNPTAEWIKLERSVCRTSNVVSLDARHFVQAACKYWRQEAVSVGLRVLETLQALYRVKNLLNYSQGTCLICIFTTAKFFIDESSLLDLKNPHLKKFQVFMQLVTENYFEIVFPLDPSQSLSAKMISLRESEQSNNLLEEVTSAIIDTKNELTYKNVGRIMVIWLGSGKTRFDVYEKVIEKFGDNPLWSSFIEILGRDPGSTVSSLDLSYKLYAALHDTYNAEWQMKDYISPHCFLYLMERLLIVIPHPRNFFYTTKSSFVEWLSFQQSDSNPSDCLAAEKQLPAQHIFDFVAGVVHQFLHVSHDTEKWIRKSDINSKIYHPVLVLRLTMIMCLVCLNSEVPFSRLSEMLTLSQIRSFLPKEFHEAIKGVKKEAVSNVAALARAFKTIGDPIMIVGSQEHIKECVCPDVISLDLKIFSSKQEIIRTLFPLSTITHDQPESLEEHNTIKPVVELPSTSENQEDGKGNLQSYMIDMLESAMGGGNFGHLKECVLAMKEKVEVHVNRLCIAIFNSSAEKRARVSSDGEADGTLTEGRTMIDDFRRLLSFLDKSESVEKNSKILRRAKDLISRTPKLNEMLSSLALKFEGEEERTITDETSRIMQTDDVARVNNSSHQAASVSSQAVEVEKPAGEFAVESSTTKGHGKKNKKKKGKGRKK